MQLADLGLEPRVVRLIGRNKRLSLEDRQRVGQALKPLYEQRQLSIRQIAEAIDRTYGVVRQWLSVAGTQFRDPCNALHGIERAYLAYQLREDFTSPSYPPSISSLAQRYEISLSMAYELLGETGIILKAGLEGRRRAELLAIVPAQFEAGRSQSSLMREHGINRTQLLSLLREAKVKRRLGRRVPE
jgi:transposase-like protein